MHATFISTTATFGIKCNIVQTGAKPQQVKKLDARSVPGIIVGMGPSTRQYRVMVLNETSAYKVHVARFFFFTHVVIAASQFNEYFSRRDALPAFQRYEVGVNVFSYECARVTEVCTFRTSICDTLLPSHELSRGSFGAAYVMNPAAIQGRENLLPEGCIRNLWERQCHQTCTQRVDG